MTDDKKHNHDHDHDHDHEIGELDCKEVVKMIFQYIDGDLKGLSRAEIEQHLKGCQSCFSRVEFESALKERVCKVGQEETPEELQKRISSLIDNL